MAFNILLITLVVSMSIILVTLLRSRSLINKNKSLRVEFEQANSHIHRLNTLCNYYRDTIDLVPNGVIILDGSKNIQYVSSTAAQLLALPKDHRIDHLPMLFNRIDPVSKDQIVNTIEQSLETGQCNEIQHVTLLKDHLSNDLNLSITVYPLFSEQNSLKALILILQDSGFKQRSIQLEATIKSMLDHLPHYFLIVEHANEGHPIQFCSREFKNDLGEAVNYSQSKSFFSMNLKFESPSALSELRQSIDNNNAYRCSVSLPGEQDSIDFELTSCPIVSENVSKGRSLISLKPVLHSRAQSPDMALSKINQHDVNLSPLQMNTAFDQAFLFGPCACVLFIEVERPLADGILKQPIGGKFIKILKSHLDHIIRKFDTSMHLGEDHFLVIMQGSETKRLAKTGCERVCEALIKDLSDSVLVNSTHWKIKTSIGIYIHEQGRVSNKDAIKKRNTGNA